VATESAAEAVEKTLPGVETGVVPAEEGVRGEDEGDEDSDEDSDGAEERREERRLPATALLVGRDVVEALGDGASDGDGEVDDDGVRLLLRREDLRVDVGVLDERRRVCWSGGGVL
jgi:hypothetical protein